MLFYGISSRNATCNSKLLIAGKFVTIWLPSPQNTKQLSHE